MCKVPENTRKLEYSPKKKTQKNTTQNKRKWKRSKSESEQSEEDKTITVSVLKQKKSPLNQPPISVRVSHMCGIPTF